MADFFQSNPNFVNPNYATPEQLATQRAYAAALMKRAPEGATRPTGAIASVLDSLTSVLERKRADELQGEAAARNAGRLGSVISQLQNGQRPDATNLGQIYADPMASPEARATVSQLIGPQATKDVYDRPAYMSPAMGVQAAPISGNFQPGFRAPESAGSVSTTTPFPAPMSGAPVSPPTTAPRPPVASSPRVWGDAEAQAAGLYPAPPAARGGAGPKVPDAVPLPAASAPAASVNSRIDALAAKDRELSAERARTEGGALAEASVIKQDIAAANDAPNVLKGVGTIKDNIQKYGDKITFGPTSPWSLEMKRAAANYAPGFMKDQLGAIAAADSINKVGIGLAGVLASQLQGGNNAETFAKSMQGVPGLTTSKEGALAMADMIQQSALKSQQLGAIYRQLEATGRLRDYQKRREEFLTQNPVINPLTKNPIEMDIESAKKTSGYEQTATNPQTGERIGLRNGSWEPIK